MGMLKVGLLLTALTALFVFVGHLIGGSGGAMIAFGLALAMNVGSYWFSDKMVLKMYNAQPLDPHTPGARSLYEMTQRMAERAQLPMPKLYVIDDPQPNAFATGRNPQNAVVAVNTGLLQMLDKEEVAGVVAHELAHIKHRDMLTMTMVATIAGAVMMLAQMAQFAAIFGGGHRDDEEGGSNPLVMLALMIFAPLAATVIQMAVSRAREYEADATGAFIAGSPSGLMNALAKLEHGAQAIPSHANPQTAHMFIVNPLSGMSGVASLFRTHPPTEERVARLRALQSQSPGSVGAWN
ncbi:MAG TPA: zinc metalloprotease HtpX [Abditibacteriaceae bacterium]|nr:zinc metalloprotease HtpX [Abditibacteriaceae bacterium]